MLIIFVILISETVVIPFTFRNAKDHVVQNSRFVTFAFTWTVYNHFL
jgi:hypothetical protein